LVTALGLALVACSQGGPTQVHQSAAPSSSTARQESLAPSLSPNAGPTTLPKIPFSTIGGRNTLLAVYDPNTFEAFLYPGAGRLVFRANEAYPGVYLFDDVRDISLYDEATEVRTTLVNGSEVGGFAFDASVTALQNLYFRGTANPVEAVLGVGDVYVKVGDPSFDHFHLGPWLGKPANLTLINALGRKHGGILSFRASYHERFLVFTTRDGGLYLFETLTGSCRALLPDFDFPPDGRAFEVRIDPYEERFIVWSDQRGRSLNMIDLLDGGITTFPYADLNLSPCWLVLAPRFIAPTEILFVAVDPDHPLTIRYFTYDFVTNHTKILVVLNDMLYVLPFVLPASGSLFFSLLAILGATDSFDPGGGGDGDGSAGGGIDSGPGGGE
jgi:hypothetical protein